jgi:hypothetical protein
MKMNQSDTPAKVGSMEGLGPNAQGLLVPMPQPVAWRHSNTHTLHENEHEMHLADAESEAVPLYLHDDVAALRDLADSEGADKVMYMRRCRRAERAIDAALPAMREFARKNPKHHFGETPQDPDGVHAWLAEFGA